MPRVYSVTDSPRLDSPSTYIPAHKRAEEHAAHVYYQNHSYLPRASSYDPYYANYVRPIRSTTTSTRETTREYNSLGGPLGYSYSTDRTTTSGSRPGDYSYSSTVSSRLPYGGTYYSTYRV